MKTYLLSCLNDIRQYSQKLDAKAVLYNKSWEVFNDMGEKETLIFRPINELLIVRNGVVQKCKWELLGVDSILIETDSVTYYLKAAFVVEMYLILQVDGTDEYMIMIESNTKEKLALNTLESIDCRLKKLSKDIKFNKEDNLIWLIVLGILVTVPLILIALSGS